MTPLLTNRNWIRLGVLFWGPFTWVCFSALFPFAMSAGGGASYQHYFLLCLPSLPVWLLAGWFWGRTMERWMGKGRERPR